MRMKKLLTLLLTAVIGCLPMWAGAGTDTYGYGSDMIKPTMTNNKNINLPVGNTGAVYYTQYLCKNTPWNSFFFSASENLAIEVKTPATDCVIETITITQFRTMSMPTLDVYVSNDATYADEVKIGTLNEDNQTINVSDYGKYPYFRLICTASASAYLNSISFTWVENKVPKCDMPTISANAYVPEGTVTLTAPTEGSTLTYSWGVDAEADVATATGTTVENAASPATITIPADAEVGKTFWVRATAKLDGYTDSEELSFSQVLGSNVLAAPRFSQPSGNVDKGSWLYIERPRYATTIHYTTDGGATYETSTDYSVGMIINENMTITAYATGDAPFKESEKVTYNYTVVTPTVDTPTIWPETGILPGTTLYLNADQDAYLSYSWGIKNGDVDVVKHEEETIQDSYVDITVPNDNIEIGYTLWVNATAKRDGYNDSEPLNFTYTFVGVKLDAPTFSIETGTKVDKGTEVTITRDSRASELHYKINDGEEQTTQDSSVNVEITEAMTIVAWATGTGIFEQSDNATASYTVETRTVVTDVITPATFGNTGDMDMTRKDYENTSGAGITYHYLGCFYNSNFFVNYDTDCILYNVTGKSIKQITVNGNSSYTYYVKFSNEAPITEVDKSGLSTVYGGYTVSPSEDAKYFAIMFNGTAMFPSVNVEYWEDTSVGVEGIAAENGEAMYFDLNGAKVNSLENAVPGVYVRVANGKATKVLVK